MMGAVTYGSGTVNRTTDEILGDDGRESTMKRGRCGERVSTHGFDDAASGYRVTTLLSHVVRRAIRRSTCGLVLAAAAVVSASCAGTNASVPGPSAEGKVRITVLTSAGCGQTAPAIEQVKTVAARLEIGLNVDQVFVETPEDAKRLHFLGSPTILVDGRDLDPSARGRTDFGLG